MRRIQSTGDVGLDREIDALWRAIDDLKRGAAAVSQSSETTQIAPGLTIASGITVREIGAVGQALYSILEVDPDSGFAVVTNGSIAQLFWAILTSKGDLLGHDGSALDRLPVGSDGDVLTANSAEALGLEWVTPSSGSGFYWMDGWFYDGANLTVSDYCKRFTGDGDRPALLPDGWIAGEAGTITVLQVKSHVARSAGTLTVEIVKNGTPTGETAVLDGTHTTLHTAVVSVSVSEGDEIELTMDTNGWSGTAANIRAQFKVE